MSPHVRESTKVLDSGSQPLDSGSQHLDSGFQPFGFRIPTFWIPDSKTIVDSGFQSLDSGFQQQKLAGFRILLHGAISDIPCSNCNSFKCATRQHGQMTTRNDKTMAADKHQGKATGHNVGAYTRLSNLEI